jgi:putative nucleotidyltransferase with HDIG domain
MRSLLLSYLMKQVYQKGENKFIQHTLWKHSLAAAFFSRELARANKSVNYEEAFIAGLMHDIGKGALLSSFPQKFEAVVERHINEQVSYLKAEENIFEFSHVEVGYLLMKKWNFAQHLIESEIYHHNCQEYHGAGKMVYIVSLANKLANLNGFSFVKINEELFETEILGLSDPFIREVEAKAMAEIEQFEKVAG